jgi:hypothetical protein
MREIEQASEGMKANILKKEELTFDDKCYCRIKAFVMSSMLKQNQAILAL